MEGDLKEVIGTLMRALGGAKITRSEVEELAFDATGNLQFALNEAYIALLEYAYDCEACGEHQKPGSDEREALQRCLDKIIECSDSPE